MNVNASLNRDANRAIFQTNEAFQAPLAWTFAAANTGSIAQHTLFTVTGDVILSLFGIVNTTLTSGGASTISAGGVGNVAALLGVTTATNLADGDVWVDTTDTRVGFGPLVAAHEFVCNDGLDVTIDILTATITAGQIDFYCLYRPLESGASVVAATPA